MIKVAVYVRVSTQEQANDGYSIPAQISLLTNYCASHQYQVYHIYQDSGISGKNIKDRPGLLQLIEDSKEKKFDMLIIWKLSRLSRSLLDMLNIVTELESRKISLISYSENFDTSTPIGKMLLHMIGSIAEFERNTIIENVKMGMNERFQQGHAKGAIPFGYINVDKKAVANMEQLEVVKYAFNHFLESETANCLTSLAEYFNGLGYKTRKGKLWTRIDIRSMLRNPFYIGMIRTGIHSRGYKLLDNAEIRKGVHEYIIDEKTFSDVQARLDASKRTSPIRNTENDSILTGLIVCPKCQGRLFALNTSYNRKNIAGETKKVYTRMYRCTKKDRNQCEGFYISSNKVEPHIMDFIKKLSKNKKMFLAMVDEFNKNATKNDDASVDKIKVYNKQLKELEATRDKYYKLFENDKIDITLFADKINEVLQNIESIKKIRDEVFKKKAQSTVSPLELYNTIKGLYDMFDYLSNAQKKEALRALIKAIYISLDKSILRMELVAGIGFDM